MRKEWKMFCRVLMVVAALALATSAANAQFNPRTLTLNCSNLGAASATVTVWSWTDDLGNALLTPKNFTVPTGTNCIGDATTSVPVSQPLTDDNGTRIAGVNYEITFSDNAVPCSMTDGFTRSLGDPIRFRDKCADTGKNASVVVRLAN
jgi:hypothetical protein